MVENRAVLETFELLERRWALRLVWELRRDSLTFGELRLAIGMSSSVLTQRLDELTRTGVVERAPGRHYRLSRAGRELARVLYELNGWAEAHRHGGGGVSSLG